MPGFGRPRLLAAKFAREELPPLTGMSQGLIEQYLGVAGQEWADSGSTQGGGANVQCPDRLPAAFLPSCWPQLAAAGGSWWSAAAKRGRTTWRPPSGGAGSADGARKLTNTGPSHEVGLQWPIQGEVARQQLGRPRLGGRPATPPAPAGGRRLGVLGLQSRDPASARLGGHARLHRGGADLPGVRAATARRPAGRARVPKTAGRATCAGCSEAESLHDGSGPQVVNQL